MFESLLFQPDLQLSCPKGQITITTARENGHVITVDCSNAATLRYGLRTLRSAGVGIRRIQKNQQNLPQPLALIVDGREWATFSPKGENQIRYLKLLPQVLISYLGW